MYKFNEIEMVHLEVTGKCNAGCPMCSRYNFDGDLHTGIVESHISKDIFYKFFNEQFIKQLKHVYFSGVYGDPCMHPDLLEFCQHLISNNVEVRLDTNAGYRKPQFWSDLARAGVKVNFAVDGLKDTNHIYRRNVIWEVVEANMRAFSAAGGDGQWNFIVFEHNEKDVEAAELYAKQLNFDFRVKVTQKFRKFSTWHVKNNGQKVFELKPSTIPLYRHDNVSNLPYESYDKFIPEKFNLSDARFSEYDNVEIQCKSLERKELFLNFEGYVLPCCYVGTLYGNGPNQQQFKDEYDWDKFSLVTHTLEEVVDNLSVIKDSWSKTTADGKILTCSQTCNKGKNELTTFVGGDKIERSTFCVLPWTHAQTKPNGQIKPCCRFDHKNEAYKLADGTFKFDKFNINKGTTYTQALESPEWQEIRTSMDNGERVPGCRKCYQEEDFQYNSIYKNPKKRVRSMRSKENWRWNRDNQDTIDANGITEPGKIRYLELALGTYCNLKCRTCTADLSSTWVEDETALSKFYTDRQVYKPIITVEENWDVRDFENVEEIKFTGGEPMLHPNFIKIIDIIIATGRQHLITLDIFTNASWVPRAKVLDRLKQFGKVVINLSVDGVGKVNDYVRAPSDWPTVEESVTEWLVAENTYPDTYIIKWAPCISIYNVWQFDQMVDWWVNLQHKIKGQGWWLSITKIQSNDVIEVPQVTMLANVVHDPKYLSASHYPDKEALITQLVHHKRNFVSKVKAEVSSEEDQWAVELQLEGIYNKVVGALYAPADPIMLKTFIEYTADLDKLRGQDLRTDIPFLWDKLNDHVEYKGRM